MSSISMLLMSAFYIFNVSQGKYLSFDTDGRASLSSTPTPIELTKADDGTGRYDDSSQQLTWVFKPINPAKKQYTIGYSVPDAYASGFLYASDDVVLTYSEPDASFTRGVWQIISQDEIENEQVTLREEDTEYLAPSLDKTYTNVTFIRKFAKNAWNSLCVPFPITREQLESEFGQGTQVAVYQNYDVPSKRLFFKTTDAVEAGMPCLLYPTQPRDNLTYSFENILSSGWAKGTEPSEVKKDNQPTYKGTYKNIGKAPKGSYIFGGNNKMYYVDSDVMMKGFRAYFMDENSSVVGAKQLSWGIGDTPTDIEVIPATNSPTAPTNIYQMDGKLAKNQATSTEGLKPGVYILNGMKVVVK